MTPIELAIEALESSCDCIQKMTDGPGRAAWGPQLDANEQAIAALRAQPASLPRLNEAQIDRILGCLDPADGGHDEIEKFLGDYLRAQPDHSELVKRLREQAHFLSGRLNTTAPLLNESADALEGI